MDKTQATASDLLASTDEPMLLLYFTCAFIVSISFAILFKTIASLDDEQVQLKGFGLSYEESDDEAPLLFQDEQARSDSEMKMRPSIAVEYKPTPRQSLTPKHKR